MQDKQIDIKEYIRHKKNTYDKLLEFLDNDNNFEESYQDFISYFDVEKKQMTNQEFKEFLHLLSKVTKHHHRELDFLNKVEKILLYFASEIKNLSNLEIFNIFKNNKLVLFLLFEMKIIVMDTDIFNFFNYKQSSRYIQYFYPECKDLIPVADQENIYKEMLKIDKNIFDNFNEKRKTGENDTLICSLIRSDSIDDFIQFVERTNFPLTSNIKQSIFETNPLLIKAEKVSVIEYASFFGSIRIVKYLLLKNVEVDNCNQLILYGIHSNNAELIQIFEDNKIISDDYSSCFLEAVTCHHNEIANHFMNNYLSEKTLDEIHLNAFYRFNNYYYFHDDIPDEITFYHLCRYKFYSIVDLHMKTKEKYFKKFFDETKIRRAADENLVDAVYYLLSKMNKIKDELFEVDDLSRTHLKRIAIPSSITVIGIKAFKNCINLKQVSLPPSLISINQYAFLKCTSITHISIPDSVKSIDSYSFKECTSLIQIKIPPSITVIEEGTFKKCTSLTTVLLPSNIVSIKNYAFSYCKSLKNISIPSSVTSIGDYAFSDCKSLKNISIPSSVTSIGDYAFSYCKSLKNISIPSSVTSIGDYAFSDCENLTKFVIPPLLTKISEGTFNRCVSLINITIPQSIQSIGIGAFSECHALTTMQIPNSIILLDDYTFNRCSSLSQITISNQTQVIGRGCFAQCNSLLGITLPITIQEIKPFAFYGCNLIRQIYIPFNLTSIDDYAFCECTELAQINIPPNVKFIGKNTFKSCPFLSDLIIPPHVIINIENRRNDELYPRLSICCESEIYLHNFKFPSSSDELYA